jgi:hypothetical protein
MTTPVTQPPRTLERTTTDPFIDGAPSHPVLIKPGGIPMKDVLTAPTTGAMDAADR